MDARPHQAMACPTCATGLVMSERQGIEIDYWPACRGVWLDRGELDKIIARSGPAQAAATPTHEPRRDHRHHDDDRHHKKRKSFLSELFD